MRKVGQVNWRGVAKGATHSVAAKRMSDAEEQPGACKIARRRYLYHKEVM